MYSTKLLIIFLSISGVAKSRNIYNTKGLRCEESMEKSSYSFFCKDNDKIVYWTAVSILPQDFEIKSTEDEMKLFYKEQKDSLFHLLQQKEIPVLPYFRHYPPRQATIVY